MTATSISVFHTPCIYVGNFNCQHTDCEYNNTYADGECLAALTSDNDLTPLQDLKGNSTCKSGRWKCQTNQNLDLVRTKTSC